MEVGGKLDLVERLSRLRDEGALDDEEFASAKANVLVQADGALPDENGYRAHSFFSSSLLKWIGGIAAAVLFAGFVGFVLLGPSTSTVPIRASADPHEQSNSSPSASSSEQTSNSSASAAMEAADAAAMAPADEAEDDGQSPEQTTTDSAQVAAPTAVSSDWRGKPGRCRINVGGHIYADGQCWVRLDSDGSFQVMSFDQNYFAQLLREDGQAKAVWNESPGSTHADAVIGYMTRHGACWSNAYGDICAWAE